MKTTLKLSTLLIALVSVFTFSSCLNSNDSSSNYATYYYPVTITGNDIIGYTFYADFGPVLRPTSASIQETIPLLGESNAERALIAFDIASETENGKDLNPEQIYDIIVLNDYFRPNIIIPTKRTFKSIEPSDTLHTNNERIKNINKDIWAYNGYVNVNLSVDYYYEPGKTTFSLNTYYTDNDIDTENNTLYLNLYYNNLKEQINSEGERLFSFRLPEEVLHDPHKQFSKDTINLVLNAITGYDDTQLTKVAECKVALKDFNTPRY